MTTRRGDRFPTRRRHSEIGATLVEFALVGPLFFAVFFATIDFGLLLLSVNGAEHAASAAASQVAALGDYYDPSTHATADTLAWKKMQSAISGNPFVKVTSMTVTRMITVSSGGSLPGGGTCGNQLCYATDTSCGGACTDRCTASGACSGTWAPCGCGTRNTTVANADSTRLDLAFNYKYFFTSGTTLSLTETRYFRLEPQS